MKTKIIIALLIPTILYGYIENAHLADDWYPQDAQTLRTTLKNLDTQAQLQYNATVIPESIKAIIVPHAALEYSGAVAAALYRLVNPHTKRVIILATDHMNHMQGIAMPYFDGLQTPLGTLHVDKTAINKLNNPLFRRSQLAFREEHSLEMQLPFIAHYLPHATIVPLIVGQVNCAQAESIAKTLQAIIDDTTLVVISSDFVHYGPEYNFTPFHDYAPLRIRDLNSQAIELLGQKACKPFAQFIDNHQPQPTICGSNPLKVLMALTQSKPFGYTEPRLVSYDNSPSMNGNQVSYVGMLFTRQKLAQLPIEQQLTQQERYNVYQYAKTVLKNLFDKPIPEALNHPIISHGLTQKHGLFITLRTLAHQLRGCTGVISSNQALWKTVQEFVKNTALHDTRFKPLTPEERGKTNLEISVLSPLKPIKKVSEIILGKHGIVLRKKDKSALFLPEVPTEFKWDLPTTLNELARKAELPEDAWQKKGTSLLVFTTLTIDHHIDK